MRKKVVREVKLSKSHAVFPKLDRDKLLKYEEHNLDLDRVKRSRIIQQLNTLASSHSQKQMFLTNKELTEHNEKKAGYEEFQKGIAALLGRYKVKEEEFIDFYKKLGQKISKLHLQTTHYNQQIHDLNTKNKEYGQSVSELNDQLIHSQQEYNEQVSYKLEFFDKAISHKNNLISDLEDQLGKAKKELAEAQKLRFLVESVISEREEINIRLKDQISSLKAKVQDKKKGTTKHKIQEIKLQITQLQSSLDLKLKEKEQRQKDLLKMKDDGQALAIEKLKLETQKDQLKNQDEDAQYLINKIKQTQESVTFLKDRSQKVREKIDKKKNKGSMVKDNLEDLQRAIVMIDKFNKFERWCYQLQDQQVGINLNVDDLIEKLEQLSNSMVLCRDKLILILGILLKSGVGGIGFFVKQYMLETKCREQLQVAQELYGLKENLKTQLKENLQRIKLKDIDSLKEEDLVDAESRNKIMEQDLESLQGRYEEALKNYQEIFKDFDGTQGRLKNAYLQEVIIKSKELIFELESSHKTMDETIKDVTMFQQELDQYGKELRSQDKSSDLIMLEEKSHEIKDDANKAKTLLLVRENKFQEVSSTDEKALNSYPIGKLFNMLTKILDFEIEIQDSKQDAYDVNQRSKDLHLLQRKIFKKTSKDLGTKLQNSIEKRKTQIENASKKDQHLLSYLDKIKAEIDSLSKQLTPEDEELNLIFQKLQQQYQDLQDANNQCSELTRQINSNIEWVDEEKQKLDFKDTNLKDVYAILDKLDKINPTVAQLNQLHGDSINKGDTCYEGLKELSHKLRTERIAQFEFFEKMTRGLLDKLQRSIARLTGRIAVIEGQHKHLNDEFVDFEKKKEGLAFKQELDVRSKEMMARNFTKEKYKSQIEDIEKKFEDVIKELDETTPSQIQELKDQLEKVQINIKKEIDDLDGDIQEDISTCKEMIDQLLIKYSSKKKLLHQSIETQEELEQQISDLNDKLDQNQLRISNIEKQLQMVEGIENLEYQKRIQEIREQAAQVTSTNEEQKANLDKTQGDIEERCDTLSFCETIVVKTKTISEILAYLLSISLDADLNSIDDSITETKSIENDTEKFITMIRNEKLIETETKQNEMIDLLAALDKLLQETGQEVQDFKQEINNVAKTQPNLKNKDTLLQTCDSFQDELRHIVMERNSCQELQDGINQSLGAYDRKSGSLKDLDFFLDKLKYLHTKITTKKTRTQEIQDEVRRLKKQFEADNWHETQRQQLLSKYRELDDFLTKLINQLTDMLKAARDLLGHLEIVYNAQLQSQDYQPHTQVEKKLRRIAQLREECDKIDASLTEILAAQKTIKDRTPNDIQDLEELKEIVKECEKLKEKAENDMAAGEKISQSVKKKRVKLSDANLPQICSKRQESLDQAKEMINNEITSLSKLEQQLEETSDEDIDPEEKKQIKQIIVDFRTEIEQIKASSIKIQELLAQIKVDIEAKDLKNTSKLQDIADIILKLLDYFNQIQHMYFEIEEYKKRMKLKGGVIQIMSIEIEIKQLRLIIEKYLKQFEDIKEQVDELSGVCTEYDDYTTEPEEDPMLKGVIKGGEEQLSGQDQTGIHFNEVLQEEDQLLAKIHSKKVAQKGNFTIQDSEEFTDLLHSLRNRFQRYEERFLKNIEGLEANQDKVCEMALEDKLSRREKEMNEIEEICVDIEKLVEEVKEQVEAEITECDFQEFFASYVKRLREMIKLLEDILTQVQELRTLKTELYEYYQNTLTKITRVRRPRIVLHKDHLYIKKRLREYMQKANGLRSRIKECQKDFKNVLKRKPVKKDKSGGKQLDENEMIDRMLAELFKKYDVQVPCKRIGNGYYMFGIKKIYCKIINGKLVVRIGGGWQAIEEFIQSNAKLELDRYNAAQAQMEKKGLKTTKAGKTKGVESVPQLPNPETPSAIPSINALGQVAPTKKGQSDKNLASGKQSGRDSKQTPSRNMSTPSLVKQDSSSNVLKVGMVGAQNDGFSGNEEVKALDVATVGSVNAFSSRRDSGASAVSHRSQVSTKTGDASAKGMTSQSSTSKIASSAGKTRNTTTVTKVSTANPPSNKTSTKTATSSAKKK